MGFRKGAYARVWEAENKGKYSVANISVSKKNKETNEYETEFQNKFVRVVGTAHKQLDSMTLPATVRIGDCDVTNKYVPDKKTTYTNYVVYNFEDNEDNNKPVTKKESISVTDDEELPFV